MLKITLFFIFLSKYVILEESNNYNFFTVSTTEIPHSNNLANFLKKILDLKLQQTRTFSRNCKEVQDNGNQNSGIYRIQPTPESDSFFAFCDMTTHGGGWTYFLNRFDGSQNFFKNWTDYKHGFGNIAKEFWLGLERLHQLTNSRLNELLIELVDWDSNQVYAMYSMFSIGSEKEGYAINLLGDYSGNAGDSLTGHAGMKFSTDDKDQDSSNKNCASDFRGAWWYENCSYSDLTGTYHKGIVEINVSAMSWGTFIGIEYSLKQARMMIRPKSHNNLSYLPHQQ